VPQRRLLLLALIPLAIAGAADARPGDRLRALFAQHAQASNESAPAVAAPVTIAYGGEPLQKLDFWAARAPADTGSTAAPAPLVIFVHGGGWQRGSKDNATGRWKPAHYLAEGYAFASIDYRLVPQATVEQQAADVAAAVRALIDRADALGIDRHRIVLMGHSAGAQLVALVGTDEAYLKGAGLRFDDLTGVIPIDGAAYDIPSQMRDGPQIMQQTYAQAFGNDPARQRALSPTLQAAAPNAARFLILHVQRPDGIRQSKALANALQAGGTTVEIASFPGEGLRGHLEINRSLGDPDYAATGVVDRWLRRAFGS